MMSCDYIAVNIFIQVTNDNRRFPAFTRSWREKNLVCPTGINHTERKLVAIYSSYLVSFLLLYFPFVLLNLLC